jgi:hypothetical protein
VNEMFCDWPSKAKPAKIIPNPSAMYTCVWMNEACYVMKTYVLI